MIKNVNLFGNKGEKTATINKLIDFNEIMQAKENEREAKNFGFSIVENFLETRKKHEPTNKFILILNVRDKKALWSVIQ